MNDARPGFELEPDDLNVRVDLTVEGDVRRISPVVERIMNEIRGTDCADGDEFAIETALREALANAVVHGCGSNPCKQVRVWVACDPAHGMIIVVRDPGAGFDPSHVPSPLHGENLYAHHGRGIYLINELMDEVQFRRGGAEIWMRKK